MTGEGLICRLKNLESIEGADKIQKSNLFGETIITSKDNKEGDLGILFDIETVLSIDFCKHNNLFRHSNLNNDKSQTGYFEDNPRVRPIKLKGVKVSGFWIPINSLSFISKKLPTEGTQIKEWEGIKICDKYVRPTRNNGNTNNKPIKKVQSVLNFAEHCDTDQLMRNLHCINVGDKLIVTSKVHGTSARCGLLPTTPKGKWKTWWHNFWNKKNEYKFVVGSRHVLKHIEGSEVDKKDSFYENDVWTESAYKYFYGKLIKGETVYYEIVGFLPNGTPIMPTHDNKKLEKFLDKAEYKEFIKKFGQKTIFHYGCSRREDYEKEYNILIDDQTVESCKLNQYKIFVYRITLTTEHGQAIDLSWDQVKRRCEELGVNHVPEITQAYITPNVGILTETLTKMVKDENYWLAMTEKDDPNFPMHLNEGICVRVENGALRPKVYKSKRYAFKVLEGIVKDSAEFADLEESN